MNYREQGFQLKYGYIYFAKYIVRFCGLLGPGAEKLTTGTSNKRKFQEASGGDRKDTKALESVNVKVRLPGDGNMRLSCSKIFNLFMCYRF